MGLQATSDELQICYASALESVTNIDIIDGFFSQLAMGSAELMKSRRVVDFDALSVMLEFTNEIDGGFVAQLVRGSPYVTLEFKGATPKVTTGYSFLKVTPLSTAPAGHSAWRLDLTNGQRWLLT